MNHIHRLSIPTPFNIGQVNCYLIVGQDHVSLIDPGPMTDEAYVTLRSNLERHDLRVDDVTSVLITHAHMDHYGLAYHISDEAGASVLAHGHTRQRLENPFSFFEREQAFFDPFLVSMGLPEELAGMVVGMSESYLDLQKPVNVDRPLTDGDVVDVGVELKVLHTPGHAPGSVCFASPEEDAVFTGDHVMADISPNPMLTLAPEAMEDRTRSLPAYITSLQRLRDTHLTTGYAGHRETVTDLARRIDEIIEHHQARKDRIAGIIAEDGPLTPYEVMEELFPGLPTKEIFPGMSEVIGHLDLLEDERRVTIESPDGVTHYSLH